MTCAPDVSSPDRPGSYASRALRPRRLPRTASPGHRPPPVPPQRPRSCVAQPRRARAGRRGPAGRCATPDAARATAAELRDVRRDLAMSLGLSPPYSPMGVVIRARVAAIDAELARRPDTGPAQAGEAGNVEISRPP